MVDELSNITCPLLVIQGANDQFGSDDQVHTICARTSGPTTRMLIRDCDHIPHFDQPDQVIKASLKHLGLAELVDG